MGGVDPHPMSIILMPEALKPRVKTAIMEIQRVLPNLTEEFVPFAPEVRLGSRLLDQFSRSDQFSQV